MNAPVTIKGWCPTALRPMRSGDGLLVRVAIAGATLQPATLAALAALADCFGNGAVDLTSRAHLQIRGVSDEGWPALVAALDALGLVSPAEKGGLPVNIVVSPLASGDRSRRASPIDARWCEAALLAGLMHDPVFAALPSKFGFAVDDGGLLPLGDVGADVSLALEDGAAAVLVRVAGAPLAARVPSHDAPAVSLRLARAFLALRADERRMDALVRRLGAPAIFAAAGLTPQASEPLGRADSRRALGAFPAGTRTVVGLAAPFGAWTAAALNAVAAATARVPSASVRVTPWRVLLADGLDAASATRLLAVGAAHDLICTAHDPRWSVSACVGAPACPSATVRTRALARDLAPHTATTLHVSGCAKGCAHPRPAALTLVGRDGRFDLVTDGTAADVPVLASLPPAQVGAALAGLRAP